VDGMMSFGVPGSPRPTGSGATLPTRNLARAESTNAGEMLFQHGTLVRAWSYRAIELNRDP
jgi:hypothetical protein